MTSATELQQKQVHALQRLGIEAKGHKWMNNIVISPKGADEVIQRLQILEDLEAGKEVISG